MISEHHLMGTKIKKYSTESCVPYDKRTDPAITVTHVHDIKGTTLAY